MLKNSGPDALDKFLDGAVHRAFRMCLAVVVLARVANPDAEHLSYKSRLAHPLAFARWGTKRHDPHATVQRTALHLR